MPVYKILFAQLAADDIADSSHRHTVDRSNAIMLMYGKEASNRKQEIDRQHHTIPNKRTKDKHYGNVHNRLWNHG